MQVALEAEIHFFAEDPLVWGVNVIWSRVL